MTVIVEFDPHPFGISDDLASGIAEAPKKKPVQTETFSAIKRDNKTLQTTFKTYEQYVLPSLTALRPANRKSKIHDWLRERMKIILSHSS